MTGRWDDGSMFIDGAWTPDDTARVGEVIDPATEVVSGSVPDADPKAAHDSGRAAGVRRRTLAADVTPAAGGGAASGGEHPR